MKKDKSCKKKGENTIGKIIYGFLLFMPLIAIGVTCGYAMFNKNANIVVSNAENIEYENPSSLVVGNRYYFDATIDQQTNTTANQVTYQFFIDNVDVDYSFWSTFNNTARRITLYKNPNSNQIIFYAYDENNVQLITQQLYREYQVKFSFNLVSINENITNNYQYFKTAFFNPPLDPYTMTTTKDAFYYGVNKVTESPLFSWAENSIIYTTMSSTCTQLSITTPFIPLIMSYWLIISVIYFLYDIALMLIWLLHDKIHEMRDSLS